MKPMYFSITCFFAIICMFLTSCYCDCALHDEQFFTLMDSKSNKNLLYGSEKKYSVDSITLFSIERKNGNNFRTDYRIESNANDSVFVAYLNTKDVKRYFIAWNLQDMDTIDIETRNTTGRCCGDQSLIEKLIFNQEECQSVSYYWSLKKTT